MSTLQRLFFGDCVAYTSGGATDGTLPPSEGNNGPGGVSRGLLLIAKKDTFITSIVVHNRHTVDAALVIAQTPQGVFYQPGQPGHHRRTPDAGVIIPKGVSWDALVGERYSLAGNEGLIFLTNIAFLNVSALIIDVIGETN